MPCARSPPIVLDEISDTSGIFGHLPKLYRREMAGVGILPKATFPIRHEATLLPSTGFTCCVTTQLFALAAG